VGYIETSKDYMIFILAQHKTFVSRDVKFEEKLASNKSRESSSLTEDKKHQAPQDEQ
jgi:hypothetical protein